MTDVKLEPCPSGHAVSDIGFDDEFEAHVIRCMECNWRTWGHTEAEAIAAWNQRHQPQEREAAGAGMSTESMVTQAEAARFWAKVDRRSDDECWLWTGSRNARGYGGFGHRGRTRKATHVSYEIATGQPFPAGLMARHSCDNPSCVNPAHIQPGTNRENVADMVSRKRHHANRRSHCIHGHPLSGANLYVRKNGQRHCQQCKRDELVNRRARVRAAKSGAAK